MIFKISVDGYCGNPVDAEHCPAANAIRKVLAPGCDVTVTHDHCTLYTKTQSHRIEFHDDVKDHIRAVDRGDRQRTFTITLDIPLGYHSLPSPPEPTLTHP